MRTLALCTFALVLPVADTSYPTSPPVLHPHFRKKIECKLPGNLELSVTHITVTCNTKGAAKMKPGGSWHLGNAHLETSAELTIGGVKVPAGKYSIKARKTEKGWELVIDKPGRFQGKVSDEGKSLKTTHDPKSAMYEHMSIDIHPSGDKTETKMNLDVRFGRHLTRCEIVVPEKSDRRR